MLIGDDLGEETRPAVRLVLRIRDVLRPRPGVVAVPSDAFDRLEEARLPDAGLTLDEQGGTSTGTPDLIEDAADRVELRLSPDQRVRARGAERDPRPDTGFAA